MYIIGTHNILFMLYLCWTNSERSFFILLSFQKRRLHFDVEILKYFSFFYFDQKLTVDGYTRNKWITIL